jgi:hypothetical protein
LLSFLLLLPSHLSLLNPYLIVMNLALNIVVVTPIASNVTPWVSNDRLRKCLIPTLGLPALIVGGTKNLKSVAYSVRTD